MNENCFRCHWCKDVFKGKPEYTLEFMHEANRTWAGKYKLCDGCGKEVYRLFNYDDAFKIRIGEIMPVGME